MKYAWIDQQRSSYPLPAMCAALGVSVSGCHAWQGGPARKRLSDLQMPTPIQSIHRELKGAYGSLRMAREPRERGFPASQARIDPIDDDGAGRDRCRDHGVVSQEASRRALPSRHASPITG
ncbi:MAG: hypothetical protein INH03_07995 [Rhodocyclaceae bacterium]|nr:hypothetical protein [Rhodocyclaceae bacterium]